MRALQHPFTLLVVGLVVFTATAASVGSLAATAPGPEPPAPACRLKSPIQHVVYLVFDNVHFSRDDPKVPSDLEQMPHLFDFIRGTGTLLTNVHTPLIAHTAGDIVTGLTGLYPDHQGQAVSNSYRYFDSAGVSHEAQSFTYWTDRLRGPDDTAYNLVSTGGANAPAPWVAFTRAGCDVGVAGVNGLALESGPVREQGVGVHCALDSPNCADQSVAVADRLPDEPGGYDGYRAVFGYSKLERRLGPLPAFPGFGAMVPDVTLAYVAAMLEHGVDVVYGYVSDAHDRRSGGAFGPGEAGYVAQLKAYDTAFAGFFQRLAGDGIDAGNTLFAFTSDEGDHFVGASPTNPACDGTTVACGYPRLGEVTLGLSGLLAQNGAGASFRLHADSAPAIYVDGNPAPGDGRVRSLERAASGLRVANPYSGVRESASAYIADRPELQLLHMVTADGARTPSFVDFLKPDYFGEEGASGVTINRGSAWNHGSVAPDINTIWLGLAGPGVQNQGVDPGTWADETDIRPTLLFAAGLKDGYRTDGRVLLEALDPRSLGASRPAYFGVSRAYKQIDAPVGDLGLKSLATSTTAVASSSAGDQQYRAHVSRVAALAADRDRLAAQMNAFLDAVAFDGRTADPVLATSLVEQADALLGRNA